ncbi:MAG: KamA family radical SAM protein [Candidatus Woesearchaeota archaeon]
MPKKMELVQTLVKKSFIQDLEKVEIWKEFLQKSIITTEQLDASCKGDIKKEMLAEVIKKYPMRINPYYLSLIRKKDDPIWKQCVPDKRELEDLKGVPDPLCEERDTKVPGLVHRYPDRALLLVSNQCAMYCRFCTRKRKVGDPFKRISKEQIMLGVDYIKNHPEVRDVILSGGDPLLLSDSYLESILKELRAIPHLDIIRIGTRVPCALPHRVTPELCEMLKKYHPLYINVHFNHPHEITEESSKACNMLANVGIPLGSQTVLLKGVNDNPETMKKLMQLLLKMRVKPYYIYMPDLVQGTNHFRPKLEKGLEIIRAIRGHTSGMAVPQLIIDAQDGKGKIPILPDYIVEKKEDKIILKNYAGELVEYPEVMDC